MEGKNFYAVLTVLNGQGLSGESGKLRGGKLSYKIEGGEVKNILVQKGQRGSCSETGMGRMYALKNMNS